MRSTHQSREWLSRSALFWFVRISTGRTLCSSCRACEAAFGCEAVVSPADAVCLTHREFWFYDCCAAERSLAGSTAATDRIAAYRVQENPAWLVHEFLN